jgi:hypothetical protein
MFLFLVLSLAVSIFTARTPEEWEVWLNSWYFDEDDDECI